MQQILKQVLDKVARPITNRVMSFKGRHKGESCYILGDGVSIKWFDLDAFREKPAFTLSCIPFHKQANALNLRYELLIQPFYFYPYCRNTSMLGKKWWRNKIKDKYIDLFKKNKRSDSFVSLSNYPVLRGSNIFHLFRTINDPDFDYLQECQVNGVDIYEGSLRAAISLAIYMGFEEIVLVGCDYTHENSRSGHWYEKGKFTLNPHTDYQKGFLEIACKYAKIITITPEGGGSILPGVTYSKFTGRPLSFRENYEIMDIETLKMLDTYPDYKIFG
jgi:hypothetical protein